ncbi:MAG: Slp family lipoprotein [Planctomycetota bacterium]|jgi:outer membrane lipoprotein
MKTFALIITLASLVHGCAHVVSDQVRTQADPGIPVVSLFKNPASYRGTIVILGGMIASSKNTGQGTFLEVVEKPLDYRGRPTQSDRSLGRFIVLHEGYLETAIYSAGKHVTVAGKVLGKKIQPLGEINYPYVFIKSIELHIVEKGKGLPVHIGIGVGATF